MKMLFATDVDGTILTDNGMPHKETNKAFKYARSKNNHIAIATGRSLSRALPLLKIMPDVNYLVCNNGALIKDISNNEILFLKYISPKYYLDVFDFAKKNDFLFTMHTNKNTYTYPRIRHENSINIDEELHLKISNFIISNPNSKSLENGEWITQLSLFGDEKLCKKNLPIVEKMFENIKSVFLTNAVFIDINPLNISKWTALTYLADHLEIKYSNIVTFGDSGNDLEMLKNAGKYGFPMKNSTVDLRAILPPKIGDNNSNAIAKKIFEIVNN